MLIGPQQQWAKVKGRRPYGVCVWGGTLTRLDRIQEVERSSGAAFPSLAIVVDHPR